MTHGIGALLLSAVGGYWVLERAARQKGQLKRVGQWLGGLIIIVSLIGAFCQVLCLATGSMGMCPLEKSKKGFFCPFSGKPATSESASNP